MKVVCFKFAFIAILGGLIGGCSTYTEQVVSQSFKPAEMPVILAKSTTTEWGDFSARAKRPFSHRSACAPDW